MTRGLTCLWVVAFAVVSFGCGGGGGTPPEPVNVAPMVDAGADQIANEGARVALTGAGRDSDGMIVSYRWEQVSGARVVLADSNAAAIRFEAPTYASGESELIFRLTVTDDRGATAFDDISVTINALPMVAAGADQSVDEGTRVELSGSGEDRDGRIESYLWEQVSGPIISPIIPSE